MDMQLSREEKTISTFLKALERVTARAYEKLSPDLHGALGSAHALVIHRHVWMDEDGRHGHVLSSEGTTWYVCNGHCTCMGAAHAPQGLCEHRLSVGLYRRASELLAASQRSQGIMAAPATLPGAPASTNTRLLIDGHTVRVTLRDTDETRLLRRLEALFARYPVAPCGGKGPSAVPGGPTCPHHGPGKESTKAPGTWYCTKKMADGSFCRWRSPEQ